MFSTFFGRNLDGRFGYQRSDVQIQSSVLYMEHYYIVSTVLKSQKQRRRERKWETFIKMVFKIFATRRFFEQKKRKLSLTERQTSGSAFWSRNLIPFLLFNDQQISIRMKTNGYCGRALTLTRQPMS